MGRASKHGGRDACWPRRCPISIEVLQTEDGKHLPIDSSTAGSGSTITFLIADILWSAFALLGSDL